METIIILHGWTHSTEKWTPFIKELEKGGYRVILPPIPGLTAPITHPYTLEDYLDWLNKELQVYKTPVHLLGHSNGGRLAIAYALKHPERIKSLVLIDSAGFVRREFAYKLKVKILMTLSKVGRFFIKNRKIKRLFYRLIREHDYERADEIMKETMKNLIKVDLIRMMKNIKTPTTIIWGRRDKITPLKYGKIMQKSLPRSRMKVLAAGHSPQFAYPKETASFIISSLRAL